MIGNRILIDMDGTLNNFPIYIKNYLEENFSLTINPNTIYKKWGISTWFIEEEKKTKECIDKAFKSKGFFLNIPPQKNSIEAVREINEYEFNDIYIVTTPYWNSRYCASEKKEWLKYHFPFIEEDKYIFTTNKSIIKADILIDDSPYNLRAWSGIKIAPLWPYNESVETNFKFNDWKELPDIIDSIEWGFI